MSLQPVARWMRLSSNYNLSAAGIGACRMSGTLTGVSQSSSGGVSSGEESHFPHRTNACPKTQEQPNARWVVQKWRACTRTQDRWKSIKLLKSAACGGSWLANRIVSCDRVWTRIDEMDPVGFLVTLKITPIHRVQDGVPAAGQIVAGFTRKGSHAEGLRCVGPAKVTCLGGTRFGHSIRLSSPQGGSASL
jgi:hypothetical protein